MNISFKIIAVLILQIFSIQQIISAEAAYQLGEALSETRDVLNKDEITGMEAEQQFILKQNEWLSELSRQYWEDEAKDARETGVPFDEWLSRHTAFEEGDGDAGANKYIKEEYHTDGVVTYSFKRDGTGNLESGLDYDGYTAVKYDGSEKIEFYIDENGNKIYCDESGLISKLEIKNENGEITGTRIYTYEKDEFDAITGITVKIESPLDKGDIGDLEKHYNSEGLLDWVRDQSGNKIEYESGRVMRIYDSAGKKIKDYSYYNTLSQISNALNLLRDDVSDKINIYENAVNLETKEKNNLKDLNTNLTNIINKLSDLEDDKSVQLADLNNKKQLVSDLLTNLETEDTNIDTYLVEVSTGYKTLINKSISVLTNQISKIEAEEEKEKRLILKKYLNDRISTLSEQLSLLDSEYKNFVDAEDSAQTVSNNSDTAYQEKLVECNAKKQEISDILVNIADVYSRIQNTGDSIQKTEYETIREDIAGLESDRDILVSALEVLLSDREKKELENVQHEYEKTVKTRLHDELILRIKNLYKDEFEIETIEDVYSKILTASLKTDAGTDYDNAVLDIDTFIDGEITNLNTDMNALRTNENTEYNSRIDDLADVVSGIKLKLGEIYTNALGAEVEYLEGYIDELETKLLLDLSTEIEAQKSLAGELFDTTSQEYSDLIGKINAIDTARKSDISSKISAMKTSITDWESGDNFNLSEWEKDQKTRLLAIKNANTTFLNEEEVLLKNELEELRKKQKREAEKIKNIKNSKLNYLESLIDELNVFNTEINTIDGSISSNQTLIDGYTTQITTKQTLLSELDGNIQDKYNDLDINRPFFINELKTRLLNFKTQDRIDKETDLAGLESDLSVIEGKITTLKSSIETIKETEGYDSVLSDIVSLTGQKEIAQSSFDESARLLQEAFGDDFSLDSIIVSKDSLLDLTEDSEGLFNDLKVNGYLNDRGVLQDKFKNLLSIDDMVLSSTYSSKKQEVFDFLKGLEEIGFEVIYDDVTGKIVDVWLRDSEENTIKLRDTLQSEINSNQSLSSGILTDTAWVKPELESFEDNSNVQKEDVCINGSFEASFNSGYYVPEGAFDNNIGGGGTNNWNHAWSYGTNAQMNQWISYEVENPKKVTSYRLWVDRQFADAMPKNWILQASNNNSDWTDLDSRSGVTDWVNDGSKKFSFENDNFYKYYRLYITQHNGGVSTGGSFGLLSEIDMFEDEYEVKMLDVGNGGTATGSTANGTYPPGGAFNNITSGSWYNSWTFKKHEVPATLQYELKESKVLSAYTLRVGGIWNDVMPSVWTFQASNNGSSWNNVRYSKWSYNMVKKRV